MIVDCPINSLSIGQVSINILRELIKRDKVSAIFPVSDDADFSAYDKLDPNTRNKIIELARQRIQRLDRNDPVLKIWHISGSERKVADNQFLYTFYETDSPTIEEVSICAQQNHVFFSSSESAEYFKQSGLRNVSYVPVGFDPDFHKVEKEYLGPDIIHFGLCGKWEKRKNTSRIINLWLKKFGNNNKYQLSCLVDNPFFKPEMMAQLKVEAMEGKHWSNINFLPRLTKNSEVNDFVNAIDVDLSGLSSSEGHNLPSFNATALGKWSVVSNCSAHKDWANDKNAILIEPEGKIPAVDGVFFHQGGAFNQGNFYKISDEAIVEGMERSLEKAKTPNEEGEKLQNEFSYEKMVDKIEKVVYSEV